MSPSARRTPLEIGSTGSANEWVGDGFNSLPLLQTKFPIPAAGRGLISRPRLTEHVRRGAEGKLTLVSAPAGFGKWTLLAEWLADSTVGARSVG